MESKTKKEWILSGGFYLLALGIILSVYQALGTNVYFSGFVTLMLLKQLQFVPLNFPSLNFCGSQFF